MTEKKLTGNKMFEMVKEECEKEIKGNVGNKGGECPNCVMDFVWE